MQNVTILGTTLQDRSIQESLSVSKRFLANGALDVVAYIDHGVLVQAEHSDSVKAFLDRTAMTLWEDKKILRLVGITDPERIAEVENRLYIKELLKSLSASKSMIAIMAEDEASAEKLKSELLAIEENLSIVHEVVMPKMLASIPEDEINSINEFAPSVIIARIDYEQQENWLRLTSSMINAGIWLAMPEGMTINSHHQSGMLRRFFYKLSFRIFSRRAKKAMEG